MKKLILSLAAITISCCASAENLNAYDGMSLKVYGFSHHADTRNHYKETNPGIGIRKHLGECFGYILPTANCFAEVSYIDQNSVGGKVYIASIGSKWTVFTTSNGYNFHVGGTLDYIRYENPVKRKTYVGIAPIPFIGIGKGPLDMDVSIISRNPLKALTGKESKAVFLLYFTYKF